MIKRLVIFCVLPLAAGVSAFLFGTTDLTGRSLAWVRGDPVIEVPEVIHLGDHEQGAEVTARFVVKNSGRGELHLRDMRTSCGCAGVERETGRQRMRISSLDLPPGMSAELMVRWMVMGTPGKPGRIAILFTTNDPRRPEVRMGLVVSSIKGGIVAYPCTVLFGSLIPGEQTKQLLELRDQSEAPRVIERVVSSDPDRVGVRLLPKDRGDENDNPSLGKLIGRVEVIARGLGKAPLIGDIRLFASSTTDPLLVIPFNGEVVSEIQLTPSTLVLPRRSGSGFVYQGTCVCRATRGTPLELEPEEVPEGLAVKIAPMTDSPTTKEIRVEYDPSRVPIGPSKKVVRLKARLAGRSVPVVIGINCLPE